MANFIESRPAFVQDVSGRENIVYQAADGTLWHARYDSDAQEWVDARAIPVDDDGPIFNLKLLSSRYLVPTGNPSDPYAPGMMLLWQEGIDNGSDLYYSVARFTNKGEVQWSDPVLIDTQDDNGNNVADENFDAEILLGKDANDKDAATIAIVEQRFNSDLLDSNGIPLDDPDLYFITLKPDDLDLVFETPSTPTAEVDLPGPEAQLPFITPDSSQALTAEPTELSGSEILGPLTAGEAGDSSAAGFALVPLASELGAALASESVEIADAALAEDGFLLVPIPLELAAGEADELENNREPFVFSFLPGIYLEERISPQGNDGSTGGRLDLGIVNFFPSKFLDNLQITADQYAEGNVLNQATGDSDFLSSFALDVGASLQLRIFDPGPGGDFGTFNNLPIKRKAGGELNLLYDGVLTWPPDSDGNAALSSLNNKFSVGLDSFYLWSVSAPDILTAIAKIEGGAFVVFDWARTYDASETPSLEDLSSFLELQTKDGSSSVPLTTDASDVNVALFPNAGLVLGAPTAGETAFSYTVMPYIQVTARAASELGLGFKAALRGYAKIPSNASDVLGISFTAQARALGVTYLQISLDEEWEIGSSNQAEVSSLEELANFSTEPELDILYSPLPGSENNYTKTGSVTAVPTNPARNVEVDTLIDGPPSLEIFSREGTDELLLAWSKGIQVTTDANGQGNKPPSSFIQLNLATPDVDTGLSWQATETDLDLSGLPIQGQGQDSIATQSSLNSDPVLGTFGSAEEQNLTNVVVWVHQDATAITNQANTTAETISEVLSNTEIRYSYLPPGEDVFGDWTRPASIVADFSPGAQISGLTLQTLTDNRVLAAWLQPLATDPGAPDEDLAENVRIYYSIWDGPGQSWSDPAFIPRDLVWTFQDLGTTLSDPETHSLLVGDFDGDGFEDVINQSETGANLLRSNRYNGSFTTATLSESAFELSDETQLLSGDFNGDGLDDVLKQDNSNTLQLFLANPDAATGFDAPQSIAVPAVARPDAQLRVGDFNGDGLSDFLRQDTTGSTANVTPFLASVSGKTVSFTAVDTTLDAAAGSQLVVGDFDGDGNDDVLVQPPATNSDPLITVLYKFLPNDPGVVVQPVGFDQTIAVGQVTLSGADVNADGITDLLRQEIVDTDNDGVLSTTALLANGDGTFTPRSEPIALFETTNPVNIVVGNFDGGADDFIAQGASNSDPTQTFNTQIIGPDLNMGLQSGLLDDQPTLFWQRNIQSSYAFTVNGDSPLLYYRLNDLASTNAANLGSLGTGYDGTYGGTLTQGKGGALQPGDYDFATEFTKGSLTVDNSLGELPTSSFSVEFWANFTEADGSIKLSQDWEIELSPELLSAQLNEPEGNFGAQANLELPLEQWHHVVVTYQPSFQVAQTGAEGLTSDPVIVPSTLALYVDAQLVAVEYDLPWTGTGNDLSLTAQGAILDEFAVYGSALTGAGTLLPDIVTPTTALESAAQIDSHFAAQLGSLGAFDTNIYQSTLDLSQNSAETTQIEPLAASIPTQLDVERAVAFDIVSPTALEPNGKIDLHFILTLDKDKNTQAFDLGRLGQEITGILLTDTTTQTKWIAGTVPGETGNPNLLGVVQGDTLLNSRDPGVTDFSHTIVGLEESFELYADPVSGTSSSNSFTVQLFFAENTPTDAIAIPAIAAGGTSPAGDLDLVSPKQVGNDNKVTGPADVPNGIVDLIFDLEIAGQKGQAIQSITLEQLQAIQPPNGPEFPQTYTWTVVGSGQPLDESDDFLGVTLNEAFLSENRQSTSTDLHTFGNSENLTFRLFADPKHVPAVPTGDTLVRTEYIATITFADGTTQTQSLNPIGADFVVTNSVLETETTNLADIDSGVILTASPFDTSGNLVSGGYSVGQTATAADFDGDGTPELALGVPGYQDRQGGVFVLLGKLNDALDLVPGEPPSNAGTEGVWIQGFANSDGYGIGAAYSLASGKIDGDNLVDLVIGAPYADMETGDRKGAVYVVYGSAIKDNAGNTLDLENLTSEQGFIISGQQAGEQFGFDVAVGNVDGQDNDEIVIGAPFYTQSTQQPDGSTTDEPVGRVYIYGDGIQADNPQVLFTGSATPTASFTNPSERQNVGAQAGFSVAISEPTHSFNGDGYADILIGSPYVYGTYSYAVPNQGILNDFGGTFSGFDEALSQSNPNLDPNTGQSTTYSRSGEAYVIYGKDTLSTLANQQKSDLSGDTGVVFTPSLETQGDVGAGFSVGFIGDVNGDGFDDAAIGAPYRNYNAGTVFVVTGRDAGGFTDSVNLSTDSDITLFSNDTQTRTGNGVTPAGDVNDDGKADFLVTSPLAGYGAGKTHVVFGDANLAQAIELSPSAQRGTLVLNGGNPQNLSGQAAIGTGDVNGDKIDDLVVTAPQVGQAYVVYGKDYLRDDGSIKLSDLRDDNGFAIETNDPKAYSLTNPATLGDVNGDGYDDILRIENPAQNRYLSLSQADNNTFAEITEANDFNLAGNFTVAFWVRIEDDQPQEITTILTKWSSKGGYPFAFRYETENPNNPTLNVFQSDGNNTVGIETGIETGSFQHVALRGVRNETNEPFVLELFLNGEQRGKTVNQVTGTKSNDSSVFFGARGLQDGGVEDLFNGDIDEVGFWSRALNNSEIEALAADRNTSSISEDQLVGFYTFNDGTGANTNTGGETAALKGTAEILPDQQVATVELGGNSKELINESAFGLTSLTASTGDPIDADGGDVIRDFNADGYDDVLVRNDGTFTLYVGSSLALVKTDTVAQPSGSTVVDVSPIGDVNGDGYDDLAILTTSSAAETAYMVYGNADGSLPNDLTSMDESEGFTVTGTNGKFRNATLAGDLNGDGFDDLVLGWTYQGKQPEPEPATGVILGLASRSDLNLGELNDLDTINQQLNSQRVFALTHSLGGANNTNALPGDIVIGIGDFNGDGFDDLALKASYGINSQGYRGQVIFSTVTAGFWNRASINSDDLVRTFGNRGIFISYTGSSNAPSFSASFGSSVSGGGDINGDGFDDLIIQQPTKTTQSANDKNETFILFGKENPYTVFALNVRTILSDPNAGFTITGLGDGKDAPGSSVKGGGDINGDGFDDLIITSPEATDSPTFVVFGGDFNGSVNQFGTLGNDDMVGTPSGENLIGQGGRDLIQGNGGPDYIQGGLDDDFITVADTHFRLVDGGPGFDGFQLAGYANQDYDLTDLLTEGRIRSIESIDLSDYGSNTLTLPDVPLLYRLSDTDNLLFITGDSDDTVAFTNLGVEDVAIVGGEQFKRFTLDKLAVLVEGEVQTTQAAPTSLPPAIVAPETSTAATLNTAVSSSSGLVSPANGTPTGGGKAQLVVSSPIANSDDDVVEFVIERTGNLSERVVAEYHTTDVEIQTRGGDHYSHVAGILVFKPGETSKTVSVPLVDNDQPTFQRPQNIGLRLKQLEVLPGSDLETLEERRVELLTPEGTAINQWQVIATPELTSDTAKPFLSVELQATLANGSDTLPLTLNYPDASLAAADALLYYDLETRSWLPWLEERQFIDLDGDGTINQALLRLTDGDRGDLDGQANGVVSTLITPAQFGQTFIGNPEQSNTLTGTIGNDRIIGGNQGDTLFGGAGNDTLEGRDGDDHLFGEADDDVLQGGAGNDRLSGGSGTNTLTGGLGNDIFEITTGETAIITDFGGMGRGSKPSATTRAAIDTLRFTTEGLTAETLQLNQVGDDLKLTFLGDETDTTVILQNFELENIDNLLKKTGANVDFDNIEFVDDALNDSIDVFNANSRRNRIWNRNSVTFLNDLNNRVRGFSHSDDVINGQGGNDTLRGLSGDDILRGGDGDDRLQGGRDDDLLRGGVGDDTVIGGHGRDTFVLAVGDGTDIIQDFKKGTDLIGLANGLSFGQLTFRGRQIRFEDQVLAVLVGVRTEQLGKESFIEV